MTKISDKSGDIKDLQVFAYKIPTETVESDGTLEWNSTTMVMVIIEAAGEKGIGYTYADVSAALFIKNNLRNIVVGKNPMDIEKTFFEMHKSIRNNGNCGIAFMALSAVDIALWDLKSKLLGLPLVSLLGKATDNIQIYGSGGFTSYSDKQLEKQLGGWSDKGIKQVKMKIGREPERDIHRIKVARESIAKDVELFVDANGAYSVKQALNIADKFEKYNIGWFEEPVSSDNLKGLSFIRDHATSFNVAAGEYGFDLPYFRDMLATGAIDVLQADATRCGGITGFIKAGKLAEAFQIPFSFHCAPSVHLHAALTLPQFFTGEYFFDHVRIEKLFFDGFQEPVNGWLFPDLSRKGLGLEFKASEAKKYLIFQGN